VSRTSHTPEARALTTRWRRLKTSGAALVGLLFASSAAQAEIQLNDPAKADGWSVTTHGRVNAYLSWIFGETINRSTLGNLVNPMDSPETGARYRLVGPQVNIQGNPTPGGAVSNPVADTDVNTPRIRGGFASTILGFNIYKQVRENLKLHVRLALWAGIQNGISGGFRNKNDAAQVDWREQFIDLSGTWGTAWGGRKVGLYSRGGMRMNWFLIHQHGVGHPCNVDSSGTATCGHTGVGSMFPNRDAQLGYATPELAGLQLSVAMFDPAMINEQWNRTPLPRFETELTYHVDRTVGKDLPKDELNAFVNALSQQVGRVAELAPQPMLHSGVPADATRNVYGIGAGLWGRISGFALGASGWYGEGLGTATPFGNTAVDELGELRKHFGYLAIANYRAGDFEVALSYGSTNAQETGWDKAPVNPDKISVIKQLRGIGGKLAYHVTPVVFSIDGMNLHHEWHRGETQDVNVVSAGMLAEW